MAKIVYTFSDLTLFPPSPLHKKLEIAKEDLFTFFGLMLLIRGLPRVALVIKNLPANAGDIRDVGLIPGLGRSPGEGHGNPLHYSCLENPHGQRSLAGYSP